MRFTGRRRAVVVAALAVCAVALTPVGAAMAETGAVAGTAPAAAPSSSQAPERVKDRYIVVLKDNPAGPRMKVDDRAKTVANRNSATVDRTYSSALRGFSTTANEQQAAKLAADPDVASIEPVVIGSIADTQPNPPSYGLDRIDQRALPLDSSYTYDNAGAGVTAYIVDTGIRFSHQDFGGRATSGPDYVDNDNNAGDCNGHGTHVAGTTGGTQYGVAKKVKLVGVRVLGCDGRGTSDASLAAIDWITKNAVKPAVTNFSISFGTFAPSIESAIKNSIASGITWSIAAGNDTGDACGYSPAKLPEGITVGNSTRNDARSSTSNFGRCLDIWAPGDSIISASHQSDTGTRTMTGTSMAAPHVAGAAALYLVAKPGSTPQQVRDGLVAQASTVTITDGRSGSTNKLLYARSGGDTTPPPAPTDCGPFTNPTDVQIQDNGPAVTSSVNATGCTGNASSATKVDVDIRHTFRGDVVLDLVAPDGSVYPLKGRDDNDAADNIIATYTVDASAEVANGTWKLRAQDVVINDSGFINSWSLTL